MPMKMVPMKTGDEEQHQRLGEGDRRLELPVEIALGHGGDPHKLLVQPAALLGDGDHLDDGAGKQLLVSPEARAERLSLLDAVDRVGNRVDQDLVADRAPRDVEGVDQRDAGAEQRAQHPGEAGHGELRQQAGR